MDLEKAVNIMREEDSDLALEFPGGIVNELENKK